MEEPLPFEMDRLYADLKAAGESKTMNQHEAAKARHAAERLAEGLNPTGREGCEHPLDELAARTEHARRRALEMWNLPAARLLNVVLTELTLV